MIEPFRLLKIPKGLNVSLERHVEITLTNQNLNDLGLWSQVNAGYLQVLEETAFPVEGLVDYLAKKDKKQTEHQLERERVTRDTGVNPRLQDKLNLSDAEAQTYTYVL